MGATGINGMGCRNFDEISAKAEGPLNANPRVRGAPWGQQNYCSTPARIIKREFYEKLDTQSGQRLARKKV